jgi:hypothetical protein
VVRELLVKVAQAALDHSLAAVRFDAQAAVVAQVQLAQTVSVQVVLVATVAMVLPHLLQEHQ